MWNNDHYYPPPRPSHHSQFPYGKRISKSAPSSPIKPLLKRTTSQQQDSFHVIHKVPSGDTPYVKAKHVQLVEKDPNRAIALFWAAINAGDRVDSALKDMAIVMKQQNRAEEAIEAIKSLRNRCSDQAQESLDNVLLDLYKRCGRLNDQIILLKHKLHLIHLGLAFNGKRTKTARSQGKKFQVSIEQEATRLLGNLGWAYMQQDNYPAAEVVYRKALSIEPDNNKVCNLGICLMKQGRMSEAKALLETVKPASTNNHWGSESHFKSYERAQEMLREMERSNGSTDAEAFDDYVVDSQLNYSSILQTEPCFTAVQSQAMAHEFIDATISGAFYATAGFGPSTRPPFHQQLSDTNIGSSWEENDRMQGFADENSSNNVVGLKDGSPGQQMQQWHNESLRQKLEREEGKLERSFSFPLPPPGVLAPSKHVLNSSAPPFVARGAQRESEVGKLNAGWVAGCMKTVEERLPMTMDCSNYLDMSPKASLSNGMERVATKPATRARRSFSLESFDDSKLGLTNGLFVGDVENMLSSPIPVASCTGTSRVVKSSKSLFSSVKENTSSPASSKLENAFLSSVKHNSETWSDLGFTESPEKLDFKSMVSFVGTVMAEVVTPFPSPSLLPPAAIAASSFDGPTAAEHQKAVVSMNDKCHRRLKVFQEMTLLASPHA